jgi:hypothetical protein
MSHETPGNPNDANNAPDFGALSAAGDPFSAWETQFNNDGAGSHTETTLQADGEMYDLPDAERAKAYDNLDEFARSGQKLDPKNYDPFAPQDPNAPATFVQNLPPDIAAEYGLNYDRIDIYADDATDTTPASTTVTAKRMTSYEADSLEGSQIMTGEETKSMTLNRDPLGVVIKGNAEAQVADLETHEAQTVQGDAFTLAETRSIIAAVEQAAKQMQEQ